MKRRKWEKKKYSRYEKKIGAVAKMYFQHRGYLHGTKKLARERGRISEELQSGKKVTIPLNFYSRSRKVIVGRNARVWRAWLMTDISALTIIFHVSPCAARRITYTRINPITVTASRRDIYLAGPTPRHVTKVSQRRRSIQPFIN